MTPAAPTPRKMKFVRGLPPNIDFIRTFLSPSPDMFFTYGDTIYGPREPGPDIYAHEEVHMAQQARLGTTRQCGHSGATRHICDRGLCEPATVDLARGAEEWWRRYRNPDFRLQQEVEAYRAHFRWWIPRVSKPSRHGVKIAIAEALRNPSYGLKITEATALRLLA